MATSTLASGRKKRLLVAICVACVCLMIAEVMLARRIHSAQLDIWQVELLVLPWVFFVGTYLSIVATSWFDSEGGRDLMRRALSLVAAAGVLGLTTVVYFGLVF